jgi:hypothetical protein
LCPWERASPILDIDRVEAVLGNAKRHRSAFVIASPEWERAIGADLLQVSGIAANHACKKTSSSFHANEPIPLPVLHFVRSEGVR